MQRTSYSLGARLTSRSNGDYLPTRFEAQAQAVSTVFSAKTDTNPESAVGLMTMAGKSCVSTLGDASGRSLTTLQALTIGHTDERYREAPLGSR